MSTTDSWLRPVSSEATEQAQETVVVNDDTLLGSTMGFLKKMANMVPFVGSSKTGPTGPTGPTGTAVQTPVMEAEGGTMDSLSMMILSLNSNPYLIASLMLLLNLGGRFLSTELTPKQEEFLQHRWLRPAIFFTVIFIATRNLAVAFWMTIVLFIILWVLANEQSPFCIIPSWRTFDTPIDEQTKTYEDNMGTIEMVAHAIPHGTS